MVRGRRTFRGGKRPFGKLQENKSKPRNKSKPFNVKEAAYVKERNLKNDQIEDRRRKLAEEREKHRTLESDSSEEEDENPLSTLLNVLTKPTTTRSMGVVSSEESDDTSDEDDLAVETIEGELTDTEVTTEGKDAISIEIEPQHLDDEQQEKEDVTVNKGCPGDPFSVQLSYELSSELLDSLQATPRVATKEKLTWPVLGDLICETYPSQSPAEPATKRAKVTLLNSKCYAKPRKAPTLLLSSKIKKDKIFDELHIKPQIRNNIARANSNNQKICELSLDLPIFTPLQEELFSIINNYQDLYYPERTATNCEEIRFIYSLHAINHVLKTRSSILHHNAKIAKAEQAKIQTEEEYRDQGLVRPKVLILVPFRHSCLKIVQQLIAIFVGEKLGVSVMNHKRFLEEFDGNALSLPKKNPKPEDYQFTFQGNTDDTFKIGICITKKSMKLYTDFYSSDIIVASPLGLRVIIGAEGEIGRDYDFLSSIELLVMDETEIFLMQNWDHLLHVLDHLHLQPKDSHGVDFSRVREWCANGWSKYYRQTLIFSSIKQPVVSSVFNKKCLNYGGKVAVFNPCMKGAVCQVIVPVPQIYHRFNLNNCLEAPEARMSFFVNKILPQFKDTIMNHTVIFIPSYFDFVRLRNYFKKEELSFVQICEYSKDAKIARARDMFYHSDAHFLLYSERFHFFRRIRLKGIRHIIFYAPPTFPHFFSELCNFMQEANQNPRAGVESNMSVTLLYSKYDILQLESIVGTERAAKMLSTKKDVHMIIAET